MNKHPSKKILLSLSLMSLLALSGCSSLFKSTGEATRPVESKEESIKSVKAAEVPRKTIPPETLYDLIIAEMGGKANRLEIALGNYMRQAHMTKDPGVIERYARISSYMQAHQATLDATELWLSVEPDNIDALHLMLTYQISQGDLAAQRSALQDLLGETAQLNVLMIEQQLNSSSNQQRTYFEKVLSELISEESLKLQNNEHLLYLKAKTNSLLGNHEEVITDGKKLLSLRKDFLPAYVLLVDSYEKRGQTDLAVQNLKKLTQLDPENKKVRIYYARLLVKSDQLKAARQEFEELRKLFPEDRDLELTTGVLASETGDYNGALQIFEGLIEANYRPNEARMQIGFILENQGKKAAAVDSFLEVSLSPFYQEARFRAAKLLAEDNVEKAVQVLESAAEKQPKNKELYTIFTAEIIAEYGSPQDALTFLNDAIKTMSEEPGLLYSRAILLSEIGEMQQSEADLRKVLKLRPDNIAALNALGYTLANQNKQLDEAEVLLRKAMALSPNDPPILDSVGWLEYRRGRLNSALEYLQLAYSLLKDHEIAAHLGEVLWLLNKQDEARKVWQEGLGINPDSKVIKETMQRLM